MVFLNNERRTITFEVQELNILSDHCLIKFGFAFSCDRVNNQEKDQYETINSKYKWNSVRKEDFINRIQQNLVIDQLNSLNTNISSCSNGEEIESCVSSFVHIIDEVSAPLFKKTFHNHDNFDSSESSNKPFSYKNDAPWFDDTCRDKRFYFYQMLNRYRENKNDDSRINMSKARSAYKTAIRKARYSFDKKKTERFENARFKNARLYWNLLKETAGIKPSNIPLTSFEKYFKVINNPTEPFYSPDEDILFFNERYERNEFNIMFEELNIDFSQDEILKAISQLKTNKSRGPD